MIAFAPDFTLDYSLLYTYTATISSNTTTDGDAVDLLNYEGPVHLFAITGDVGDASTQIVISIIDCDTSSGSYVAINGATTTLAGSATANDKQGIMVKADNRPKRFVKSRVVTSGGTASVPITLAFFARKKVAGGAGVELTPN